jgi:type I restriction enzyme S subunit
MPSNYKRLGDYIHKVENRNRDLKVSNLVGLSMTKEFRVSTSNIVGTDMSVYKVVNKWQFSCDFMSVIRVHKFPVVLKTDDEPVLVSPAYTVFEVNDENELNPEYLMMWFKRSEFDRYADFKCDSAIRGGFDWDALCDCMLPIPSIEKQRELVREYNVIQNRILLNNHLISKLEETAQAIYKHWFVDFEFPDKNGKPYKSNGGKMVWCEELEKEIPEGWSVPIIGDIVETIGGGTPSTDEDEYWVNGDIPWYSPTDVTRSNSMFSSLTERKITEKGLQKSSAKMFPPYSLLMTSRATVGKLTINIKEACTNQGFITLIPTEKISVYLLYDWIKTQLEEITSLATGSTFPEISKTDFRNLKFIYPNEDILNKYKKPILHVYKTVQFRNEENQKLEELKDLLLARMTRV